MQSARMILLAKLKLAALSRSGFPNTLTFLLAVRARGQGAESCLRGYPGMAAILDANLEFESGCVTYRLLATFAHASPLESTCSVRIKGLSRIASY